MNDRQSDLDRQTSSRSLTKAREIRADRLTALNVQAIAVSRAMEGWPHVSDDEDWMDLCRESVDDYNDGTFLIERLGAERHLDPKLMATLGGLRKALLEESGAGTAAEKMLVDSVIIAYYNSL